MANPAVTSSTANPIINKNKAGHTNLTVLENFLKFVSLITFFFLKKSESIPPNAIAKATVK